MSNIVDNVFAEVCLDERISDGIFRLEEEEHMNALRDYFVKKGITKDAAVEVTNRMLEGRFPERQAYNKDGILVTFPTPQHKAKAIQRGTHFEKNPAPQNSTPPKEEPAGGVVNKVQQGGVELSVEPPRGSEKPESAPVPQAPQVPQAPRTPERIAAEKEVIKQILATDDTALNPVDLSLSENSNPELETNMREMREKIVKVVNSLPYPELKELYNRVFIKYVYGARGF